MLSSANDHASRLYQAIIPGSKQHRTTMHYTDPRYTRKIFFRLLLRNIYKTPLAGCKPGYVTKRYALLQTNRSMGRYKDWHTHVSGRISHDEGPIAQEREACSGRERHLMTPLRRNEEGLALDGYLSLTPAERAALMPLESLHPELCPQELAERTVRCLCALVQETQTPAPTQTPRRRSHDVKDFWLCLSSNILMM